MGGARTVARTEVVVVMMVVMRMMPSRFIPIGIVPAPVVTVVRSVPGVVPIAIVTVVIARSIVIVVVVGRTVGIKAPVPGVAIINIGVASGAASSVIVVIVVERRGGVGAETLDAGCEVCIVVGLGGGIDHAVGVGHGLRGLIDGLSGSLVGAGVVVIRLVAVGGASSDAGTHCAALLGIVRLRIVVG